MSVLKISNLVAGVDDKEILKGVNLEVKSGEVHAVMGPNGSGKSTLAHVLMGRPGYTVTSGSVTIDDEPILDLPTWQRAQKGLFLAMQYPIEVPGVSTDTALREAFNARSEDTVHLSDSISTEAERIGLATRLLERPLNVDLSGGGKKRSETLQASILKPKFAVLDEIDSGLDIDALRAVARRFEAATSEFNVGVLAITHYSRLLDELKPDVIHVLSRGQIVKTGGPELAEQLEQSGYAEWGEEEQPEEDSKDPFADL